MAQATVPNNVAPIFPDDIEWRPEHYIKAAELSHGNPGVSVWKRRAEFVFPHYYGIRTPKEIRQAKDSDLLKMENFGKAALRIMRLLFGSDQVMIFSLDRVFDLKEQLDREITTLVNRRLAGEHPEVEDLVRTQLGEQFRFWKS